MALFSLALLPFLNLQVGESFLLVNQLSCRECCQRPSWHHQQQPNIAEASQVKHQSGPRVHCSAVCTRVQGQLQQQQYHPLPAVRGWLHRGFRSQLWCRAPHFRNHIRPYLGMQPEISSARGSLHKCPRSRSEVALAAEKQDGHWSWSRHNWQPQA